MTDRNESLPPQLREALDIMGRHGKVVELTAPAKEETQPCDGCGHPEHVAHECPVTRYGERCACDEPSVEPEAPEADAPCPATLREDSMADTAYCQERGHHQRHTSGCCSEYYVWLDGDEGAGWER